MLLSVDMPPSLGDRLCEHHASRRISGMQVSSFKAFFHCTQLSPEIADNPKGPMDRAASEKGDRSTSEPQSEKSSGSSLLDAARRVRLRQRKLARQKADNAPEGAEAKDVSEGPEAKSAGEGGEGQKEAELAGGEKGDEEAKEGGSTPDQALEVAMKGQEGPLPCEDEMKKRFKGKSPRVRCFFGPEAQKACKMVGAKAFAVGNILVFADANPDAQVVAHELEHVVQQGDAPEPSGPLEMTEAGDPEEQEAEAKEKEDPEKAGGEADPSKAPAADGGGGGGQEQAKAEGEEKQGGEGEKAGGEERSAEADAKEQKGKPAKLARYQAIQSPQGQLNVPLRSAPNAPGGIPVIVTTRVVRMTEQPAPAPGQPNWVQVRVTTGDDMGLTGWVRSDELGEQPETEQISQGDATRLFNELAGAALPGSDTPIPFHFPPDGCWGRAQIMANLLTEKGYASEKVFAVSQKQQAGGGPTTPGLNVATNFGPDAAPGGQAGVQWWYHVAPIIQVRSPEGRISRMVMDPSMASGPITVAAWTGMMAPEQFHEVPLAGVQQMMQQNRGTLYNSPTAINHPMTFTTDRNTMTPDDAGNVGAGGPGTTSNTPASVGAELNANMGVLQNYAKLAQLHELAASIRELLPRAPGNSDQIVQRVRDFATDPQDKMALAHFASPGSGAYSGNFPNLVADMRRQLTPAAMAQIDALVAEGNALAAAAQSGAAAGSAAGGTGGGGGGGGTH
jgi:hypothetical protein